MKSSTLSFMQTMLTRLFAAAFIGVGVWYALAEIAQKLEISIGDPLRLLASIGVALIGWYVASRALDFERKFDYVPPKMVAGGAKRSNGDGDDYDS